jgi:hypothetical protein
MVGATRLSSGSRWNVKEERIRREERARVEIVVIAVGVVVLWWLDADEIVRLPTPMAKAMTIRCCQAAKACRNCRMGIGIVAVSTGTFNVTAVNGIKLWIIAG